MNTTTASRPNRARALFGGLAAVLFGTLVATSIPLSAVAAPDVDLVIKVTSKSGTPLAGVEVLAIPASDTVFPFDSIEYSNEYDTYREALLDQGGVAGTATGTTGSYQLNGLETDAAYLLLFVPANSTSGAHWQFWGGSSEAAEADRYWTGSVAGTEYLDVSLAANSSMTGKVTNSSGSGLRNIWVTAYRWNGSDWSYVDAVKTGSSGSYALRHLDAGSYKLEFDGQYEGTGYLTEFSGDKLTLEAATAFDLKFGATITHNAKLSTGGKITGKVRFSYEGDTYPAQWIVPIAYPLLGTSPSFTGVDLYRPYYGKQSSSSGAWSVSGLPTGNYVVKLVDFYECSLAFPDDAPCDDWELEARFAGGGLAWNSGSTLKFAVTNGSTASPTASSTTMPLKTTVSRANLNLNVKFSGVNVAGAEVIIESTTGDYWFESATNSSGNLFVPRLMPDTYELSVVSYATDGSGERLHAPHFAEFTVSSSSTINRFVTLQPFEPLEFTDVPVTSPDPNKVGSTFTVEPELNVVDGIEIVYQWKRDGVPIYGARSASYTLASGDAGHQLSVSVAAWAYGYPNIYTTVELAGLTAEGDAPVIGELTDFGIRTAGGVLNPESVTPGEKLSVATGQWTPAGVAFAYQWHADGAPISGATAKSYTVTPADADAGVELTVELTASRVGHATAAPIVSNGVDVELLAAPIVKTAPVVTKSTTGQPVGTTKFTVSKGTWSVSGLSYCYRWLVDGETVIDESEDCSENPGSNSLATATSGDEVIEVTVIVSRSGYEGASRTVLARKGSFANVSELDGGEVLNLGNSGTPIASSVEEVYVGDVLQVIEPQFDFELDGGGTVKIAYQWSRNGVAISGATKDGYKVTSSDVGKTLQVRVTTTSSLYGVMNSYLDGGTGALRHELHTGSAPDIYVDGHGGVNVVHSSFTVGSWDVAGVSHSFQWFRCAEAAIVDCGDTAVAPWIPITGATGVNFTPPTSLTGQFIGIQLTGKKAGYATRTIFDSLPIQLGVNPQIDFFSPGQPVYSSGLVGGDAAVGAPITVTAGRYNVSSPTISYQWLMCADVASGACDEIEDFVPISGATAKSYTPTASLLADYEAPLLTVNVTLAKTGFTSVTDHAPIVSLVEGTLKASTAPKVTSGTSAWSASGGVWNAPVTVQVDWAVDGVVVLTNSSTFPKAGTAGQLVEAIFTVSASGFVTTERTVLAQKGSPTPTPGAAVTGDTFGQTLVAPGVDDLVDYPDGTGPDPSVKYQWYSGSTAISGATKSTFKPSSSYVGKSLKVRVTASSAKFATVSVFSGVVVLQKASFAGSANLDIDTTLGGVELWGGTNLVGAKHVARPLFFDTPSVSYSYRWYSSTNGTTWTALSATSSSYTVPLSMLGKHLKVVLTAKKTGYDTLVLEDVLGEVFETAQLTAVNPPTLGTVKVGSPVTVDVGTWNASGITYSYVWFRNGVAMPGVTGASWTPIAESVGDTLRVEVTAKKSGHVTGAASSNLVVIQLGDAPTATTAPAITGTAKLGQTLKVSTGVWNRSGLEFGYQWYADGVEIVGAQGNAFTLTGDQVGARITVVVTASSSAYASGERLTASTAIVVP